MVLRLQSEKGKITTHLYMKVRFVNLKNAMKLRSKPISKINLQGQLLSTSSEDAIVYLVIKSVHLFKSISKQPDIKEEL